jgi:hypothetical protein
MEDINNNLKLIKNGTIIDLDYNDKIQYQYKFKNYNDNVINFIFSLKKEDIDFDYHLANINPNLLINFIDEIKNNGIELNSIKKQKDSLMNLYYLECINTQNSFLSKEERSQVFNKYIDYRESDYYMQERLFTNIDFEKLINLKENLAYPSTSSRYTSAISIIADAGNFNDFKNKFDDNIDNFSLYFDLNSLTSDINYEKYLINSFEISRNIKAIISMKGFDYEKGFSTLEPILPSADKKKSFVNIVISNFFDNKELIKLDDSKLNGLVKFIEKNNIEIDADKIMKNFYDTVNCNRFLNICDKAPEFISYLEKLNPEKMEEIKQAELKSLFIREIFIADLYNVEDLKNKLQLIQKQNEFNTLNVKKEDFDNSFEKLKEKISIKMEYDIFDQKYKTFIANASKEDLELYKHVIDMVEKDRNTCNLFGMKEIILKHKDTLSTILTPFYAITDEEKKKIDDSLNQVDEIKANLELNINFSKTKTKKLKN